MGVTLQWWHAGRWGEVANEPTDGHHFTMWAYSQAASDTKFDSRYKRIVGSMTCGLQVEQAC